MIKVFTMKASTIDNIVLPLLLLLNISVMILSLIVNQTFMDWLTCMVWVSFTIWFALQGDWEDE